MKPDCVLGLATGSSPVVMIVTGANKAQILKDAFCGPIVPEVPASILQLHPDFILVADEAALSLAEGLL